MKTFSIRQIRNLFAVLILGTLFSTAYFLNSGLLKAPTAKAGASQNVSGWAYSKGNGSALNDDKSGIGWISLNSLDCDVDDNGYTDSGVCDGDNITTISRNYGVDISPLIGTGIFTGYAWSENIGWISFDRAVTNNPPSAPFDGGSGPIAQVDWSTGAVTGWARALVGCEETAGVPVTSCASSGAGATVGGWDGWIKFSDDSNSFWNGSGVKITSGNFSGYAWGGDVAGWIDFAPTVGGFLISNPPIVTILACSNGTNNPPLCSQCPNGNIYDTGVAQCIPCAGTGCTGDGDTTTVPSTTLVCNGGATAPPYCNSCSTGQAWNGSSCVLCAGVGGCSGAGGIPSGGNAICINGNSNPPFCDVPYNTNDGVCSLGEPLTSADCKPTTKFWQF